jgi:hypothetical protein
MLSEVRDMREDSNNLKTRVMTLKTTFGLLEARLTDLLDHLEAKL